VHWDYSRSAAYFITLNTHDRAHYFGHVDETGMNRSILGECAMEQWVKTPELRSDMNLTLGGYVAMPDHFHAILEIGKNQYNEGGAEDSRQKSFQQQSKNLASILRGYKSSVTTFARKNDLEFQWQPRFHDRIIRTPEEYGNVEQYIIDNPAKWFEQHR
jgi:putative transposase